MRKLSSYNCTIDNKDADDKLGITWPIFAAEDSVGKFLLALWVDCIVFLSTWVTTILFVVSTLFFATSFKRKEVSLSLEST